MIIINKLEPKLRFKEFSGEWKLSKVNNIIRTIDAGWSPQCLKKSVEKDEWGVLKTTAVVWSGFNEKENKRLPLNLEPRSEIQVKKNDILITRAGPTSRVGVVALVEKINKNLMLSDKIIRLRVNQDNNHSFISKVLSSKKVQYQLVRKSSGLAESQTNISQKIIKDAKINLPYIQEQEKIASFLSSVDTKIENLESKKELLEQYKKGIMQKIFSSDSFRSNEHLPLAQEEGKSVRFKPTSAEDMGKYGEEYPNWEEKKYGDIYSFHSTNSLSRDKLNYKNGNVKNIHYGDIHTKFSTLFSAINEEIPFINLDVDISKIKEENYCQIGDLVIADASEDYKDIGKTIEIANLNNFKILAGLHTFLARPSKGKIYIGFMGHLLKSWNVRKQVMKIAQGSKVLSLSTTRLSQIKLSLPCLEEQEKIANFLSDIDKKINLVEEEIDSNKNFKKGLLQQMFV